jgi:hypothetical protein
LSGQPAGGPLSIIIFKGAIKYYFIFRCAAPPNLLLPANSTNISPRCGLLGYYGALHLKNDYDHFVLSILRHAVACLSVSISYFLKVQRTGMFVENMPALILKAASQRNIIITGKIQFPTIQFHISVRCINTKTETNILYFALSRSS